MNTEKFSEAMSEIGSKYVDEAINYKQKAKRPGWIKWGAMAACICLIAVAVMTIPSFLRQQENNGVKVNEKAATQDLVAAPGILMLTAYAASPDGDIMTELPIDEEIIMQEGIEVPLNYNWSLAMSSRPGIPLKLSTPEYPDLIFEVLVDGGELLFWGAGDIKYLGSSYKAENDSTIYWTSMTQTEEGDFELYTENEAYINIIMREEKNIVGYAVVEIYKGGLEDEPSHTYYAKLLKSTSFPKVNGKYQNVSSEYVASEAERIKSEAQDKKGKIR